MLQQGRVEWLAGDPQEATALVRPGFAHLRKAGDKANQALCGSFLARLLCELAREEEALDVTEEVRRIAGSYDVSMQIEWRSVQSVVLARRGRFEEARDLMGEAEDLVRRTDFLTVLADTLVLKAEVLRLAGRRDEAVRAAEEALSLWEQKEYAPLVAKTRTLLEELAR